jgi:hypothetical protein
LNRGIAIGFDGCRRQFTKALVMGHKPVASSENPAPRLRVPRKGIASSQARSARVALANAVSAISACRTAKGCWRDPGRCVFDLDQPFID